jgi:hypothetical protein
MSVSEIVTMLKANGIEMKATGENLKITASPGKLTPEQRTLILDHKAAILTFLKEGETKQNVEPPMPSLEAPGSEPIKPEIYRDYKFSNGETLQVTQEEFDNVVDVYRMLWMLEKKYSRKQKVA